MFLTTCESFIRRVELFKYKILSFLGSLKVGIVRTVRPKEIYDEMNLSIPEKTFLEKFKHDTDVVLEALKELVLEGRILKMEINGINYYSVM